MRTLAVDLGSRRVGLALSDEAGKFATPYDVLMVKGADEALGSVMDLVEREGVKRVVIGLPLNMDGSLGRGARSAIGWGSQLPDDLEVHYVDERLSSFEAEQRLIERKRGGERISREQKKRMLDAQAAAGFLQEFLDGKLRPLITTMSQ